jgi:5-methylcytosine-specific restriction endonuclease McrA
VEYFEIMAKNTNKRIPVKWVRDRAKAAYEKKTECCVCGSAADLELHHLHSVTILLDKWSEAKGYDISTDAGILAVRDEFIDEHRVELYDQVYTLCNRHHVALHSVYGKAPRPGSEPKQAHWIETQRAKHTGGTVETVVPKKSFGSFFSEFT